MALTRSAVSSASAAATGVGWAGCALPARYRRMICRSGTAPARMGADGAGEKRGQHSMNSGALPVWMILRERLGWMRPSAASFDQKATHIQAAPAHTDALAASRPNAAGVMAAKTPPSKATASETGCCSRRRLLAATLCPPSAGRASAAIPDAGAATESRSTNKSVFGFIAKEGKQK